MSQTLTYVAPGDIVAEDNVRLNTDLGDIEGLAQSIASVGLMQPVTAQLNDDGKYALEAGFRRFAAIQFGILNGVLPADFEVAVLTNGTDDGQTRRIRQMVENLQRLDLDPIEEAEGYQGLLDDGLRQKDLAERIGKSSSHISKRLSLLKLTDELKVRVADGRIPLDIGVKLTKVTAQDLIDDLLAEKVLTSHLVDRVLRAQARRDELAKAVDGISARIDGEKVFTDMQALQDYVSSTIPAGTVTVETDVESQLSVPADADAVYVGFSWDPAGGGEKISYTVVSYLPEEEAAELEQAELEQAQAELTPYQKAVDTRNDARARLTKARNAESAERRAWMAWVVAETQPAKTAVLGVVFKYLLASTGNMVFTPLCAALGLEPIVENGKDSKTPVLEYAEKSAANLQRVIVGIVMYATSSGYFEGKDELDAVLRETFDYQVDEAVVREMKAALNAFNKAEKLVDKEAEAARKAEDEANGDEEF